jgi:hypothetical protein
MSFILPLLIPLVPIFQAFEWKTMLKISDHQKSETIEGVYANIKKFGLETFMKGERKIRNVLYLILFFYFVWNISIKIYSLVSPLSFLWIGLDQTESQLTFVEISLVYLFLTPVFIYIFKKAFDKLSSYKGFSKSRTSMISFFVFEVIIQTMILLMGAVSMYYNQLQDQKSDYKIPAFSIPLNYAYYQLADAKYYCHIPRIYKTPEDEKAAMDYYKVEFEALQSNKFIIIERAFFVFYVFFFPLIQSFGLIFVKKSLDPLSNISKLNHLKLVSINQSGTESFTDGEIKENKESIAKHQQSFLKKMTSIKLTT